VTFGNVYYYRVFTYDKYNNCNSETGNFQSLWKNIDFTSFDYSDFQNYGNWYIDTYNNGSISLPCTEIPEPLIMKDIIITPGCTGQLFALVEITYGDELYIYNNDIEQQVVKNGGTYKIDLSSGINSIKFEFNRDTLRGYCSIHQILIKYIV
jgi:hypothetical protein